MHGEVRRMLANYKCEEDGLYLSGIVGETPKLYFLVLLFF